MEQVENIIGQPSSLRTSEDQNLFVKQAFYDSLEMRIDYNKFDKVEFIEFLSGPWPEKSELSIYGINPFSIDGEELIKTLSLRSNEKVDDTEAPYSYAFPDIGVGIWRDANPKDIEFWIDEKRNSGEYENDKDWLNEELEKSKHFWTIGIGNNEYYK